MFAASCQAPSSSAPSPKRQTLIRSEPSSRNAKPEPTAEEGEEGEGAEDEAGESAGEESSENG